jgi:predicted NACHT family NTPase
MQSKNYSWQRFWCLNGDSLQLDNEGFLPDPENDYERYYNPNLVTLEDISHIPCLILLGEAGIGKTTTMKAEYEKLKAQIEQSEDTCLWFDLRYSANNSSSNYVFNHHIFKIWENGTHKLHLFLDSLDEGLLALNTIDLILEQEIDQLCCDRLYLRITCRTTDWNNILTEKFQEKWGKNNTKIYHLCPLRRKDVIEALNKRQIEIEPFFQELFLKEIVPFATQPITFKLLLDIYKENYQFPNSKKDLYFEGCLMLCKEIHNKYRLKPKFKGKLSEKKRLIIAGRIAMIIIFANKVAIWIHSDSSDKPDSDITIDSLYNESYFREKNINNQEFDVTREDIEEVLSISGLFSSKGTNRLGFAHKTYAEFLAAWYLNHHQISLPQIMSLIVATEDVQRKLIPQLHQTCAWLSSMRKDVLEKIIETNPDVALKGDIPDDNELKRRIVDKLLKLYEEEKLFDPYFTNSFQSHKLNHPQLAEQLRPYIQDKNKSENVRREAINIARRCQIINLQKDLVQLILDKFESIDLRVKSCACISAIGNRQARAKLKPLVMADLPEDTDDSLKFSILETLWTQEHPDLTAQELFSALTPPKQSYMISSYHTFISSKLICHLDLKDLVIALDWVKKQGVRYDLSGSLSIRELADKILLKAWENFDDPEIVKCFAQIALIQWNQPQNLILDHEKSEVFREEFEKNNDKRRKLIEQFVLIVPESINDIGYKFGYFRGNNDKASFLEKDIFWLIEKIEKNQDESIQKIYIDLIEHNFNRQNVAQIDAICSIYKEYKKDNINYIFTDKFSMYFDAIDLDSEQGKKAKSFYYKYEKDKKKLQNINPLKLSPSERILMCVEEIELGNIAYWTSLCREMSLLYNTSPYGHDFKLNLMELPGWKNADDSTKKRIIESAKKYILEKENLNYDWIGTNQVNLLAIAGCKALYLLLNIEPDFVEQLEPSIWQKWASIIIATPNYDGNKEDQYLKLIYSAYSNAKTESIDTLVKLIDRENRESEYIFIIDKFKNCWDEELKSVILKIIKDSQLKPKSLEILCQELIKHSCSEVIEFIHYHEDPIYFGSIVGVRDQVVSLRNHVLSELGDTKTIQGCQEIERIIGVFPKLSWLKQYLYDAQKNVRLNNWQPPTPKQLFQLIGDSRKRLVNDGNQLLDVLIESLQRLENELQGETPAVRDIWDKVNSNSEYKPVNENEFSDYVKRFLDRDLDLKQKGIIANREVELRPSQGNAKGERTDIHVDAIIKSNGKISDCITAIIEVKGCWHKELNTAMETQLVDRYLKDNTCKYGIYLIGWFYCPQWNNEDKRKEKTPKITLEEAKAKFDQQAKDLSVSGVNVKAFVLNTALR